MGLFTSKIFVGVMAGTVTLGGLGLLFNGTETLEKASEFVRDSGNKIVQYEGNENNLVAKIATIKENAKTTNQANQDRIAQLESDKTELETTVEGLNGQVSRLTTEVEGLKTSLATEKGDHQATKDQLAAKIVELDSAKEELAKAKKDIATLNASLQYALGKAKQADKVVTELEAEVTKANAEVEAHGTVVDENETKTEGSEPMTQEEIDAIGTDVE